MRIALTALGFYVLFQIAVSASAIIRPGYDLADLSLPDRLNWLAGRVVSWEAYAEPLGIFFFYLASIKWLLFDRRVNVGGIGSAAYYAIFGLYYGVLFMNGFSGGLHGEFDRALAINPGALLSAMFPLSLALLVPLALTLFVSISFRRNATQDSL